MTRFAKRIQALRATKDSMVSLCRTLLAFVHLSPKAAAVIALTALTLISLGCAFFPRFTFATLQVVGLMLAAGAATASLLKSKGIEETTLEPIIVGADPKVIRRISLPAKIGISFLVGGLLVSFVAKSLEQFMAARETTKRQQETLRQLKNTDEQLQLARQSIAALAGQAADTKVILSKLQQQAEFSQVTLDQIQRLVSRFESVRAVATFELPASDFQVKELATILDQVIKADREATLHPQPGTYSLGLNFYWLAPDKYAFTRKPATSREGANTVLHFSSDELLHLETLSSRSSADTNRLLKLLLNPVTTLRIGADDFTATANGIIGVKFDYLFPADRLRVTWTIEYSSKDWYLTGKVTSLPDIAGSRIFLSLDNFPLTPSSGGPHSPLKPKWDTHAVSLDLVVNTTPIKCKPEHVGGDTGSAVPVAISVAPPLETYMPHKQARLHTANL
jgi:hypothetical protein